MKIDKCFDWLVRFAYPGVHEGCVWSEIPLQGRLSFYSSSPPTGESSPRKRVLSRLCAAGARKMSKPQNGSRFLHTGAARPRPIRQQQQQQPGSISMFISHHATHVSHNSNNINARALWKRIDRWKDAGNAEPDHRRTSHLLFGSWSYVKIVCNCMPCAVSLPHTLGRRTQNQ